MSQKGEPVVFPSLTSRLFRKPCGPSGNLATTELVGKVVGMLPESLPTQLIEQA